MKKIITINTIITASKNIDEAKQLSEIILISKNPELNYYAVLHLQINKKEHLETVINTKDPIYNYKCIKHCTKTYTLTIEEKKYFISKHSEIILNSNNEKLIKELKQFFKYNKLENQETHIGNNNKKRNRKKSIEKK